MVANLGSFKIYPTGAEANGTFAVLDGSNSVVSVVEVSKLLGDSGHQHPHDVTFVGTQGDVAVATWCVRGGGGRGGGVLAMTTLCNSKFTPPNMNRLPGRLSYWKRTPNAK